MTLSPLLHLDPIESVGVLARAALALETGDSNPAAAPRVAEETSIRNKIYEIAALENNLTNIADDPGRISDWITDQLDETAPRPDVDAALSRLSRAALLSSDEYQIEFKEQFFDKITYQHGDREAAVTIIRSPDGTTDYGENPPDRPSMLMLLGRWMGAPSDKNFYLGLVACQKVGFRLEVISLWKVIPSVVNLKGCSDIFEIYQRFCVHYGFDIELFGRKGKFIPHMVVVRDERYNVVEQFVRNLKVFNAGRLPFENTTVLMPAGDKIVISFSSALNLNNYFKDLRKKGIGVGNR